MTQELRVLTVEHCFQNHDTHLQDYPKLPKIALKTL